ncbi:MAG: hypothetical protein LBU91_09710 [Bacteroidales bacterium]|jgi:hypothetical protein|nr:hypothetical protein [Bacteroidales bacterium]
MKKILILLVIALIAMTSFAQSNGNSLEHLTFKGVPINGTLSEYVTKMKQQGFTHVGTEDGFALLQGDFAGYKNCTVGVVTLKPKNLVSNVTVIFPECDTWSSLASNYFSLKEMLTEKYGEPLESVEEFDSYSEPKDDGSKMASVQLDQCKYYAIYETEKGSIELSIRGDITSCFVRLSYYDKINGDKMKDAAMDDL